jgi:uncharacterized protein
MVEAKHRFTNSLISESSPYLLQHAHNPVNWLVWDEKAFVKAKTENKLILVSIGYSACHWCHVMEHESFEDEAIAKMMNDLFVCVKVDREERPDVDQVYMSAVQLMTGRGGWPLNCFILPDGRPLYGGTYFPKQQWTEVLTNLATLWKSDTEKCFQYANELTLGIKQEDKIIIDTTIADFTIETLDQSVEKWKLRFDNSEGGPNRAPKFPLPNNYQFLLRYSFFKNDAIILKHVLLTLDKMAYGGIYDQVGGGFARYSTDVLWKVPHFEKMLYDNSALISLYSEAFQLTKKQLYKDVVFESLGFIARELTAVNGAFYAALDADSEGVEGKYYVWTAQELKIILGEDFNWFADYYNINSFGYWEESNFILLRRDDEKLVADRNGMSVEYLKERNLEVKTVLLAQREKRIRPGTDDKIITSWNAMMLKAYSDAYDVFGEQDFLLAALKNARFIRDVQLRSDGGLFHTWSARFSLDPSKGKSSINGFLDDYAFTIDALITLYQSTFDEEWLLLSKNLTEYVFKHFSDKHSPMFFYTSDDDPKLITRKIELSDNVIPASNAVMAKNLFYLGHLTGNSDWVEFSASMLRAMKKEILGYGAGYSNWMMLQLHFVFPFRELVIVGKSVDKTKELLRKHYLPNQIFAGSFGVSNLPLLQHRYVEDLTLIYVCENQTCQMPMENVDDVLKQLKKNSFDV